MQLLAKHLEAISGGTITAAKGANIASIIAGFDTFGARAQMDRPWRMAHYLAQIAHESGRFLYDREVWGPTPAQSRYDIREDLGNTPARDGDGKLYAGRTGMQLTGRANYTAFRDWCRAEGLNPPDFVKNPELVNTDPWEGLVPIWYWTKGNPTGKSLNVYADANNAEMITRRINGGLNGYAERLELYTRSGLVLLGYAMRGGVIAEFQRAIGFTGDDIDDVDGPKTRNAIHNALLKHEPAKAPAPIPIPPPTPDEPEASASPSTGRAPADIAADLRRLADEIEQKAA